MRTLMVGIAVAACGPTAKNVDDGGVRPNGDGGSDSGSDATMCVPATCTDSHASCGAVSDGCGHTLECGTCSYERCVANQCVNVNRMSVFLSRTARQNADGTMTVAPSYLAAVCFYHPVPPYMPGPPLATNGACTVNRYLPTDPPPLPYDPGLFAGSAGTVTVHGGLVDPIVLSPSSQSTGCYSANVAPGTTALFGDGARLSISGTGGSDFPAFSLQVTVPPPLQVDTGSVQRGAPLAVRWSGTDPGLQVYVGVGVINDTTNAYTLISCSVEDSGAYTIPASLTQLLDTGPSRSYIRIDRKHVVHQEPASPGVVIDAEIVTIADRNETYTP